MIEPTIHIVCTKDFKGLDSIESKLKELNYDIVVFVPEEKTYDLEAIKPSLVLKFNELKERADNRGKIVPVLKPNSINEIRKKRPRIYR